jgi:hypothetical protein
MPSIATKRAIIAALLTLTSVAATAKDEPPRFLPVPALGLRVELADLKLEKFPDEILRMCNQIADDERSVGHLWVFAKAKDAASTYYVLSGYFTFRNLPPDRRPYELGDWVMVVQGNKCGGDPNADETFASHDPNADNNGNVPDRILKVLAVDLAARTVKAFGGPEKLRAEIRSQRIDFDRLSPELQEAFKPYFVNQEPSSARKSASGSGRPSR